MLPINYFEKETTTKNLTLPTNKQPTRKQSKKIHALSTNGFSYYLLWIDRTEYPDFVTWLADMIKTGNLIEETEEKTA